MVTNIRELPFSATVLDTIEAMGITTLYPPQAEAMESVLSGRNFVLSVPTASGKSLVAYLAILRGLAKGGKGLYIVPLRALASEKFEELKGILPKGYRAVMSIGDYEEKDSGIMKNDVIIATSEKADSLFRHRPEFLREFSVVVADEVHLITDPGRGHILEVLMTRLRQTSPDTQLVALSATIPNSQEIADWLEADHLRSEWRPVDLKEGVFQGGVLRIQQRKGSDDLEVREIGQGEPVKKLVSDGLSQGGQSLVFVNTRKSAEVEAKRLRGAVKGHTDREKLLEIRDMLLTTQDEPTDIVSRLADCVEGGCGFHHAGLGNNQRKIIERAFKMGYIKALAATPTLAAGVNLPARRVIIRDLTRYGGRHAGNRPIANLELKQMAGRAGRPGYDPYGEAIYIARRQEDVKRIFTEVVNGETERIESKLGVAPILRIHIISSIASGYVRTYRELMDFLGRTFYARQFGIREREVKEALRFLRENDMMISPDPGTTSDFVTADSLASIPTYSRDEGYSDDHGSQGVAGEKVGEVSSREKNELSEKVEEEGSREKNELSEEEGSREKNELSEKEGSREKDGSRGKDEEDGSRGKDVLRTTPFGKLISDLYIDPKSAVVMRRALIGSAGKTATPLSYLQAIAATPDMLTLYAREGEMGELLMKAEAYADELFLSPLDREVYGENQGLAHELFAEELKTAILLKRWIDEVDENTITRSFGIGPGDLRNRVDTARWLLHAMERIAALFHFERDGLKKVLRRIVYGVKEELIPLVALKGVGRVRARILFNGGYRDVSMLKKAEVEDLWAMDGIGKVSVFRIMEQLGRDMSEYEEADQEIRRLQRSLLDFGI